MGKIETMEEKCNKLKDYICSRHRIHVSIRVKCMDGYTVYVQRYDSSEFYERDIKTVNELYMFLLGIEVSNYGI